MKKLILAFTFVSSLFACQSGSGDNFERGVMDSKSMAPAMEEAQSVGGNAPDKISIENQKIIRNGHMTISVKDALQIRKDINALLAKHNAYAGNEQLDNNDYQVSYNIQIRVPADHLDALISDLEALDGNVTFKSIQAQDVTEEYIDLETRLNNKKSYVEQYKTLLKNAKTIEDILKVREEIRQLEEEIESVTGRLKYLKNQVDLSTLDLTLTEMKDYVYRPDYKVNFFERTKDAFSGGWYAFVSFCIELFRLWPFWIVGILIIFFWRRYRRGKKGSSK